jgi:hypothetical protein
MKSIVAALLCAALLTGCNLSPVLSKKELVDWYTANHRTLSNLERFGYAGSDEKYHYFITRPIDYFYFPKIPRTELQMPDERPRSQLGRGDLYFYPVDPGNNFKRVPDRWSHPDPAASSSRDTGTAHTPDP